MKIFISFMSLLLVPTIRSLFASNSRLFIDKKIITRHSINMSSMNNDLVLDKFALRQFNNPQYTGTQVYYDEDLFEATVNEYYRNGIKSYHIDSFRSLNSYSYS